MNVCEYILDFFSKKGIDRAYAVAGSAAMWLFDALNGNQKIRALCSNHEQAAVMAADGWARLTKLPGLAIITNGPGVTNALSGVAQAWTDSCPLIVINGESRLNMVQHEIESSMRQYGPQNVRTDIIASAVTKYYCIIEKPEDTRKIIEAAFYRALEGRPGPVWITIPIDIQNKTVPDFMEGFDIPEEPSINTNMIKTIKREILSAERPLIIAGQGVRQSGAREEFLDLIKDYSIPVVTSRMGNDTIPSDNDLFVGRPGNWGMRSAHFAIQTADKILIMGSRLSVNTTGYNPESFAPNAQKFLVDIDTKEFAKPGIRFDITLHCDVLEFIRKFKEIQVVDNKYNIRTAWSARCRKWKEKYPVMQPEYYDAFPMSSYYFIDALSRKAREDSVILSDTGTCCNIISQVWNVKPRQRLLLSGGLSCMGYWATAIGAAQANGEEGETICVVGDGSFQMNIQELGTIGLYKIPIKIFVINNDGYQIIRISQNSYMNGRFFAISPETGVGIADTRRVARAYGIDYVKLKYPKDADRIISKVLEKKGPVICEAITNKDQLTLPRLSSKIYTDGSLIQAAYEDLAPFLPEDELKRNLEK